MEISCWIFSSLFSLWIASECHEHWMTLVNASKRKERRKKINRILTVPISIYIKIHRTSFCSQFSNIHVTIAYYSTFLFYGFQFDRLTILNSLEQFNVYLFPFFCFSFSPPPPSQLLLFLSFPRYICSL